MEEPNSKEIEELPDENAALNISLSNKQIKKRFLLLPSDNTWKKSKNSVITTIRKDDNFCRMLTDTDAPNNEECVFLRDINRNSVFINNNQKNFETKELLEEFLTSEYSQEEAQQLIKHYNQPLNGLSLSIINGCKITVIDPNTNESKRLLVLNRQYSTDVYKAKDGNIYLDTELFQVEIGVPFKEVFKIPGKIKVYFKLTNEGFQLEWLAASNSLLFELCQGKTKKITQEKIDFSIQEEELFSLIESENYDEEIKNSALSVLNSAIHDKDVCPNNTLHLQKIIFYTAEFIKNGNHMDGKSFEHYLKLAHITAQSSSGKILGGAMMIFAGLAIMTLSIMLMVASCGVTTPLSAMGLAVGTSTLILGLSAISAVAGTVATLLSLKMTLNASKKTKETIEDKVLNLIEIKKNSL